MAPLRDVRATRATDTGVDLTGYVVHVCVGTGTGKKQQNFQIHSSVIMPRSGYFRALLGNNYGEENKTKIDLPDENPETFSLYMQLIYNNNIVLVDDSEADDIKYGSEYLALAKLFVLAERLQDVATKDLVLETILTKAQSIWSDGERRFPGWKYVKIIYEGTWLNKTTPEKVWHPEFLYDLASNLMRRRKQPEGSIIFECKASAYHEM
ncbi:hypothetical protein BDV96DRAFT_627272 [Lophiotrema nucula]|uniref:BTB domain-containing protein n=1 Tax=Lophiotrema nucula TaxID=690887 RepID=A0A6A5ZRL4_9PLEO|nr:hypothetical protein BDV96DRAFT_627272 [Lophiotrema nucula]